MNRLREWWQAKSAGERRLLLPGAVLVVLALAYLLLWAPVMEERARLRGQLTEARSDLAWMRGAASEVKRIAARQVGGRRSLQDTLSGLAPRPKITEVDHGAEVRFDGIRSDLLMRWLDRVRRDTAWVVRGASIVRLESGRVSADIELLEPVR